MFDEGDTGQLTEAQLHEFMRTMAMELPALSGMEVSSPANPNPDDVALRHAPCYLRSVVAGQEEGKRGGVGG